jgi:hypothetical protein
MGEEEDTERHAEHGGGIGSGAGVDHRRSLDGMTSPICLLVTGLVIRFDGLRLHTNGVRSMLDQITGMQVFARVAALGSLPGIRKARSAAEIETAAKVKAGNKQV